MFSIKHNIDKFLSDEWKDVRTSTKKATRSANTKVARQASTAAKKEVRNYYTIPASKLNEATKIKAGTNEDPSAKIIVTGKSLALSYYRALKNKIKGATAMIIKGKRVVIPGDKSEGTKTFVSTMKSGHKGIFFRTTKERLPVTERKGPSAPDLMRSRRAIDAIKLYVKTNYNRLFDAEYKYFKRK